MTTTRILALVEKEGRLQVVPPGDHGERPDARTGPDSGGPTMGEEQQGVCGRPPTNNQLGARDRFLPHPCAPKKQTCAVNGGTSTEKSNCRMKWICDSHSVPCEGHSRIGGDVSAGCGRLYRTTSMLLYIAPLSTLGLGLVGSVSDEALDAGDVTSLAR
jgi:hypothetical protein